jgi:pSer/pThr/pTyr-binding forkhead associated (FHA) protein
VSTPKVQKALRFKNADVPRQTGEVARVRVLKGPDQGVVFVLKESSMTFGRGEDVDVMISDLKASRSHARLDFTREGWIMNDLGSANGIFFQGEYIRKFAVTSGEHFTVGDTIFEFFTNSESTRVITAPMRSALEVSNSDQSLINQRMKVKGLAKAAQTAAPAAGSVKKKDNKRTLILLALLGGGYLYMDQAPEPHRAAVVKKSDKKEDADRSLSSYLPAGVSRDIEKVAEQYYRQGFREYREGNYLRAKAQFELALQVNPDHSFARHYLASAEHEIDVEIKKMISTAQKATVAGRLREAKGYYETAMRLMYYDRSNPDFIDCDESLKKINEELNRNRQ